MDEFDMMILEGTGIDDEERLQANVASSHQLPRAFASRCTIVPPEAKPRHSDEMHDPIFLRFAGSIFGLTLMTMADAFNQFHVAHQDLC